MQNTDEGRQAEGPHHRPGGIGFGLFLLAVGAALLAESLGWLPKGTDWLLPVILIAWGAGELYARLKA